MAYRVEVEYKNYQTGETRTWLKGQTYKTRGRAEKAAQLVSGIVRPNGGEKLSETWGRVVEDVCPANGWPITAKAVYWLVIPIKELL